MEGTTANHPQSRGDAVPTASTPALDSLTTYSPMDSLRELVAATRDAHEAMINAKSAFYQGKMSMDEMMQYRLKYQRLDRTLRTQTKRKPYAHIERELKAKYGR